MLLVADIGNSNIVLGVFEGERLRASWRVTSRQHASNDEYIAMLSVLLGRAGLADANSGGLIEAAIISSVVPPLTQKISEVLAELCGVTPLVVGPGLKTGLDVRYDDPREVGADRIVNAVGALTKYAPPLLIIDSGTATTFDVVLAPNVYAGGIIVPGLFIARDALVERTAMLPKVELRATAQVLGRNTADSIRSGLFHGTGAMVDGLVAKLSAELSISPTVIAAGGMGSLMAEASAAIQHLEPDLTLIGLREIWLRNAQ